VFLPIEKTSQEQRRARLQECGKVLPQLQRAARFVVSVLLGACFYLVWMGLFLVSIPYQSPFSRGLLWILAPVITALGFSAGAVLFIRFRRLPCPSLLRLYLYPLIGCSIGAAVVFPFGPMLIVFGMCLLGSLSMFLFEIVDSAIVGIEKGRYASRQSLPSSVRVA
jgi:hypothetical protein